MENQANVIAVILIKTRQNGIFEYSIGQKLICMKWDCRGCISCQITKKKENVKNGQYEQEMVGQKRCFHWFDQISFPIKSSTVCTLRTVGVWGNVKKKLFQCYVSG